MYKLLFEVTERITLPIDLIERSLCHS